jgi:hypothetical protein
VKPATPVFTGLLVYGVLTLWIEERWAWSAFQLGVFLLAGWRALRHLSLRPPAALVPLAGAALWPLVQLAASTTLSRADTWDAAVNWITFAAVFAIACDLLSDSRSRRWFTRAVSLFGMCLAAVATAQKYSSGGRIFWLFPSGYTDEVLGPFVNRNQYAAWAELVLPMALYLAATDRRLRVLYGTAAAALFGSVIASASRTGSILACAEVVAVLAAVGARRAAPRRALVVGALQLGVFAAVATAVVGWQDLGQRFQNSGPEVLRVEAVRTSIQMVRDRPWMGSGLGTWPIVFPRYADFDNGLVMPAAHNDWLQWAAEGGLPFALLLGIFGALLWKPAVQSIFGLGTIAFLLHALVDFPMQLRPALAAWFFAIAGAAAAWRTGRTAGTDGLLRGARTRADGGPGGNPEGIQEARAPAPSGSMPG